MSAHRAGVYRRVVRRDANGVRRALDSVLFELDKRGILISQVLADTPLPHGEVDKWRSVQLTFNGHIANQHPVLVRSSWPLGSCVLLLGFAVDDLCEWHRNDVTVFGASRFGEPVGSILPHE